MNDYAVTFTFGFLLGILAAIVSVRALNHDHRRLEVLRVHVVRVGEYIPCDTRRGDTWLDDAMGVDCAGFSTARARVGR